MEFNGSTIKKLNNLVNRIEENLIDSKKFFRIAFDPSVCYIIISVKDKYRISGYF